MAQLQFSKKACQLRVEIISLEFNPSTLPDVGYTAKKSQIITERPEFRIIDPNTILRNT